MKMEETVFNEYLIRKKIDPTRFRIGDPDTYSKFEELFDSVHENSFTAQKLFLLNEIRRTFHYSKPNEEKEPLSKTKIKPTMK